MIKRILFSLLAYVLCAHALPVIATADPTQPIVPLTPAELIACMPPAPKKWIVTRSVAKNTFSTWISTVAERDFLRPPPPPLPGAPVPPKPPPPVTMTVSITDTGNAADFKSLFSQPKSGSLPSGFTMLKINDFPATKEVVDDTTTNLNILIKNRFLVEIQAKNLSDDDLQACANGFDFSKLVSTPDTGETNLPNPVIITQIDELNPQKNGSYALHYATQKAHN